LNAELLRKAAELVGNPNVLVNVISRRVRQLNAAGGSGSRPLLVETATMGAADIALSELVEARMGWELLSSPAEDEGGSGKKRRKS